MNMRRKDYENISTSSLEKILCILDTIKERADLIPKKADEVRIPISAFDCKCDFPECESILKRIKEEGLIVDFRPLNDYI